jgi:nicotinate-nucleotide--dimethylbenzimidazole phosphoribosyltransferase
LKYYYWLCTNIHLKCIKPAFYAATSEYLCKAGANDETLMRKIEVVRRGIKINQPDRNDPFDIVQKVGGLEIAALVGLVIGAAANRTAIITDGFIATAAVALAVKACPAIAEYVFFAHLSAEQGHRLLLEFIGQEPLFDLKMRRGEETGAALAINVIAAGAAYFNEMETFAGANISDRN